MTQSDSFSHPKTQMSDLDTLTGEPRFPEASTELDRLGEQSHFGRYSLGGSPDNIALIIRRRRRLRMLRFIVLEMIAIGVTVASAIAGISIRFAAESLTSVFRVLPVGAAVIAAILPIAFFGHPERRTACDAKTRQGARLARSIRYRKQSLRGGCASHMAACRPARQLLECSNNGEGVSSFCYP